MKTQQGLPARWQRGRMLATLFTLLIVSGITYFIRGIGKSDALDNWWLRARFSFRERMRGIQTDPDIVLVTLDDICGDQWKEPSIVWNSHLAKGVDRLRLSGAKVIAFDWIQPEATEDWLGGNGRFANNDGVLAEALGKTDRVVFAKAIRIDRNRPSQVLPYLGFVSASKSAAKTSDLDQFVGYVDLSRESLVTSMTPKIRSKEDESSFALRIAEQATHSKSAFIGSSLQLTDSGTSTKLREDDTLLINYANGTGKADFVSHNESERAFSRISLYDLCNLPEKPNARFKDKLVIIGETRTAGNDQHAIPFLEGSGGVRQAYGVEIQANLVRNLLSGSCLREFTGIQNWFLCIGFAALGVIPFLRLRWAVAAGTNLGIGILWTVLSFVLFPGAGGGYVLPVFLPLASLVLSGALIGSYLALSEERERKQVMKLWGKYQHPKLVEYLLEHPEARGGEGLEIPITCLFADLKNFTKTVEHLSPTDTIASLNLYLAMIEECVNLHGGVVDKYLGDGLMAQWGAPVAPGSSVISDHARRAVMACLEIEKRAAILLGAANPEDKRQVSFGIRLSLHTGPVIFGWVGGGSKLELTVIGDVVNVTSRLQETAKAMDVEFLISESVYSHVKGQIRTGKQGEVEIRGRKQPLSVYEVIGKTEENS